MRRLVWPVAATVLALALACAHRQDLSRPSAQDDFGVQMAKMNLWREAMFRFQRAVQIAPGDAQAHNNLAVAYEANGDFENARKEYLEALKLDRSNSYIQKNYSRFVEFLSRNRKRQQATETKTAGPLTPKVGGGATVIDPAPPARPVGVETPRPVPPQPAPPATPPATPPPTPPATTTAPPPPHGGLA